MFFSASVNSGPPCGMVPSSTALTFILSLPATMLQSTVQFLPPFCTALLWQLSQRFAIKSFTVVNKDPVLVFDVTVIEVVFSQPSPSFANTVYAPAARLVKVPEAW